MEQTRLAIVERTHSTMIKFSTPTRHKALYTSRLSNRSSLASWKDSMEQYSHMARQQVERHIRCSGPISSMRPREVWFHAWSAIYSKRLAMHRKRWNFKSMCPWWRYTWKRCTTLLILRPRTSRLEKKKERESTSKMWLKFRSQTKVKSIKSWCKVLRIGRLALLIWMQGARALTPASLLQFNRLIKGPSVRRLDSSI